MTRIRYTMPARSQGKLYTQRTMARLAEKDVHRRVFAENMDPDVEPLVRLHLAIRDRTHIVLNNAPLLHAMHRDDEAVEVDAHGMKPTGLNPHLSVCGWPFCLDELNGDGR